jgi:hypothetical protein
VLLLIFDSRQVQYNKILDLTDASVRQKLGINLDSIVKSYSRDPLAYELTQQIGDLAKKYGFDAIKLPSAEMFEAKKMGITIVNIVIPPRIE